MTTVIALATATMIALVAARVQPRRARLIALGVTDRVAGGGTLAALEDIERDLQSGAALVEAVRAALRRHPETLRDVCRQLETGARLRDVLRSSDPTRPAEVLAVQTLRACEHNGGAMGAAVERAVLVLRERDAWERERRVHAAQARLSATVLTLVPLVFAASAAATSPRIRRAYVEIPLCGITALIGLVVNLGGWFWMRRLIEGGRR